MDYSSLAAMGEPLAFRSFDHRRGRPRRGVRVRTCGDAQPDATPVAPARFDQVLPGDPGAGGVLGETSACNFTRIRSCRIALF